MDNQKNNNQANIPDEKPVEPISNGQPANPNQGVNTSPQEAYTTYSSLPNIFNNMPAVSQNRNIPPRPQPVQNGTQQQGRPPMPNGTQQQGRPPMPNGAQQQGRPPMPNGAQQQGRPPMPNGAQQQGRPPMPNGAQQQGRPPMPNGAQQQGRPPMPNGAQQQVRPPMPNGVQQQGRPTTPNDKQQPVKRPSEGRAFAKEFYSQPNTDTQFKPHPVDNAQDKIQQPVANPQERTQPAFNPNTQERTQQVVNPQAKPQQPITNAQERVQPVANTQDKTQQQQTDHLPSAEINRDFNDNYDKPKRDIKYNYQALTPPDKKSTTIVIAIYVVVVVLLLVGIIGYAISIGGSSGFKDSYSDLFGDFNLEDVFADDDSDARYPDFSDSDFNNEVYSEELTYTDEDSIEHTVTIYSPSGYVYDEFFSSDDLVAFIDPNTGVNCEAWLTTGNTDDVNELFTRIINPDNEDYSANNTVEYYQTIDFEAYIEKIEFNDREQLFAIAEIDEDVLLVISATKDLIIEYPEEVDSDTILVSVEQMLDRVSLY